MPHEKEGEEGEAFDSSVLIEHTRERNSTNEETARPSREKRVKCKIVSGILNAREIS